MSIFSQAKALPEPKTKAKTKANDGVEVKGLEDYALIDALIKSLGAVKDTLAVAIKDESRELFVSVKDKKRPPNLKAYDGDATASIQLQKRSTRSPLSTDEVELLTEHGIPYDTVEDRAETFVINPSYANDGALLGKIDKALKGVKGLPDDFILKQTSISKHVVSDESILTMFDKELARDLVDTLCTLAVKPSLANPDLQKALALAASIVADQKAAAREALMKNLKDSAKKA